MALRVFLGLVVAATVIRVAPMLVLRLVLLLPGQRVARTVRFVRAVFSAPSPISGELDHARTPRWIGITPVQLVLVSSSLLALMALIATALLKWHPVGLLLLLR